MTLDLDHVLMLNEFPAINCLRRKQNLSVKVTTDEDYVRGYAHNLIDGEYHVQVLSEVISPTQILSPTYLNRSVSISFPVILELAIAKSTSPASKASTTATAPKISESTVDGINDDAKDDISPSSVIEDPADSVTDRSILEETSIVVSNQKKDVSKKVIIGLLD